MAQEVNGDQAFPSPDQVDEALKAFRQGSAVPFEKLLSSSESHLHGVCGLFGDMVQPQVDDLHGIREIDDYRIIGEIGRGGMGTVYKAWQECTGRIVALKVIHRMGVTRARRKQLFRREVDTLARLKHPHIATLYDAGEIEDQHFFAMELVSGDTLENYINTKVTPGKPGQASLQERLELFQKICRAMSYAHQRGVIHCDLKPSNIFVNAEGEPKILDFGLAKLLDTDISVMTTMMDSGKIIGTLPYMSPEQARGQVQEIDTRSDVYALGAILYEILTGKRPLRVQGSALAEAVRVICEEPVQIPPTNTPQLDIDLKTITLKALEKEPDRRYATADAFADDIMRYLSHQPILARTPSTTYQIRKWVNRHRLSSLLIAALSLVMLLSAIGFGIQASRLARERDNAQAEAWRAEEANAFLVEMFASLDAERVGPSILVHEVLDAAAMKLETELTAGPIVRASLHDVIGRSYLMLREDEKAEYHLHTAYELRRIVLGDRHIDTVTSLHHWGCAIGTSDDWKKAGKHLEAAYELRCELLGNDHVDVAQSLYALAEYRKSSDDFAGAEACYRRALEMRRRLLGDHVDVAHSLLGLAKFLVETGRFDKADPLLNEALRMRRSLPGDHSYQISCTLAEFGEICYYRADYDGAERFFQERIRILQTIFMGEPSYDLANALSDLAIIRGVRGELVEAERLHRAAVEMQKAILGDESIHLALNLNNFACFLRDQGRCKEAEPLFRDVKRRWLAGSDGISHPSPAYAGQNLASVLIELGAYTETEQLCLDAISIWRDLSGDRSWKTVNASVVLARMRLLTGDYSESERLCRDIVDISRNHFGENHPTVALGRIHLADALNEQCDAGAATEYRTAIVSLRKTHGDQHADVAFGLGRLAWFELESNNPKEAERLFREAVAIERALPRKHHPMLAESLTGLAETLILRNQVIEAESFARESLSIQQLRLVENDRRTAITRSALGQCLLLLGKYEEAGTELHRSYKIISACFGQDHRHTRRVLQRLGALEKHGAISIK